MGLTKALIKIYDCNPVNYVLRYVLNTTKLEFIRYPLVKINFKQAYNDNMSMRKLTTRDKHLCVYKQLIVPTSR